MTNGFSTHLAESKHDKNSNIFFYKYNSERYIRLD